MKTLVIHPFDHSTDDLEDIYRGIDCTVHRSNRKVHHLIKSHDRIICLGHGTEMGLLQIPYNGAFLVDSRHVQLLRERECIFIWCYANLFMKKYGIKGFATGMFISEMDEALQYCVPFERGQIEESNRTFAGIVREHIHLPANDMKQPILEKYGQLTSPVSQFNLSELCH